MRLALPLCSGSNPPPIPEWQAWFRKHQPPTLVAWGKNGAIFPAEGAHPFKQDLRDVEFHLRDTGDIALEEDGPTFARLIPDFVRMERSARQAGQVPGRICLPLA